MSLLRPGGTKQPRVSATPPPRTLNVQKFAESRAAELETLHLIVTNRLNSDFRSRRNKRRRTTGHNDRVANNRSRKRRKLGVPGLSNAVVAEKSQEKVPRRIRRRIELRKNPDSGFCASGDGTKRLRTHVWHAKRFAMTKLWGFHLPLGMQGRGRGSRALLKRFKDGALIHDASYYGIVQLEGPQDSLLQMLSTVLVPSQSSQLDDDSHSVLSGAIYATAMLHHIGAPFSPAVAPVTYMWRPFHQPSIVVDAEYHDVDGYNKPKGTESCYSFRQLWVSIHAAGFSQGYDVLKLASQKQLAKCLDAESDTNSRIEKFPILENEDHISPSAIISLTISDPRDLPEKKALLVSEATSTSTLGSMKEDEGKELWKNGGDGALSVSMDLWDASKGILPPVEENILCMEKHHKKLAFFCLDNTNLGKQNASTEGLFCRLCPILLLNNSNRKGSVAR
ncbi:ribonuclease P [Sarracenia purpurea var. burkii]